MCGGGGIEFEEDFSPIFLHGRRVVGSLSDDSSSCLVSSLAYSVEIIKDWSLNSQYPSVVLPSHSTRGMFEKMEKVALQKLYSRMYGVPTVSIEVNATFIKYKSITLNSKLIGAYKSRSSHSSIVMCNWHPLFTGNINSEDRPTHINYFAKHTVII